VVFDRLVELQPVRLREAVFELGHEDAQLARRRLPAGLSGACEAVPRSRERQEIGALAAAVGREHRADAAVIVDVRADNHALVAAHAREHRFARGSRHAVDRQAQALDCIGGVAAAISHRLCPARSPGGRERRGRGQP
jgi:hypothetical protein